jgi:hypothetical protein
LLVEARFTLGTVQNADSWGVGVASRFSEGAGKMHYLLCQAWIDLGNARHPTPYPEVAVWYESAKTQDDGLGSWPPETPSAPPFDAAAGATYYLQLFATDDIRKWLPDACEPWEERCPAVLCHLFDEGDTIRGTHYTLYNFRSQEALLPEAGGQVGFRVYGRAATFDYIRVFERSEGLP